MGNIRRVPFTEMVERVQGEIVRDKAANVASEKKYKGIINDVYIDFAILLPETLLEKTASFTTKEDYSTGTITVSEGDSSVVGSGTSWTQANSDGALFKADDEETVYRVSYGTGMSLTLSDPSSWVDDDVSAGSYRLLFDRYALPSDFSHMAEDDEDDPEVVYYYSGTGRQFLEPRDNGQFEKEFSFIYGTPANYTVKWIDSDPYIYIWPCDDDTRRIFYRYIPQLQPMVEFTTGTASCNMDSTAVTGSGTFWGDFIDTTANDYYFRFDVDGTGQASQWYKITSITNDTALVLDSNYTGEANRSGENYTISMVPKWPPKYDRAIMYTAAYMVDPSNTDAARWEKIAASIIPGWNSVFGKRIYNKRG